LRVVVEYRRRSNKEELDEEEEDQTRRKEFISQNLSKTLSQWRLETQYSLLC
jgi:transposase